MDTCIMVRTLLEVENCVRRVENSRWHAKGTGWRAELSLCFKSQGLRNSDEQENIIFDLGGSAGKFHGYFPVISVFWKWVGG